MLLSCIILRMHFLNTQILANGDPYAFFKMSIGKGPDVRRKGEDGLGQFGPALFAFQAPLANGQFKEGVADPLLL